MSRSNPILDQFKKQHSVFRNVNRTTGSMQRSSIYSGNKQKINRPAVLANPINNWGGNK